MKKLILSIALAIMVNLAFGQKIKSVNFTGCLATAFLQFSSTGPSQDQAAPGWVSAIAAPSVDVSKITDLTVQIESFSQVGGKVEIPATLPADFSAATQCPLGANVPVFYTQSYMKEGGKLTTPTTPPNWRKIQVFINPLTIAGLPLNISKTGTVQPGYSYAGEVPANGANVQLHTNGHMVYLAFNSAAKELSFEMENNGKVDDVNENAYVYVEQSADLKTWKKLKEIQLVAPESPAVKTPYTIAVTDASTRYIRIRIDGLKNGRSSRREVIRNISLK